MENKVGINFLESQRKFLFLKELGFKSTHEQISFETELDFIPNVKKMEQAINSVLTEFCVSPVEKSDEVYTEIENYLTNDFSKSVTDDRLDENGLTRSFKAGEKLKTSIRYFSENKIKWEVHFNAFYFDMWSVKVFYEEVMNNYHGRATQQKECVEYFELVQSQLDFYQSNIDKKKDYWKSEFKMLPDQFEFKNKNKLKNLTLETSTVSALIPTAVFDSIQTYSKDRNVAVDSIFFAISQLLINKYLDINNFILGYTFNNRSKENSKVIAPLALQSPIQCEVIGNEIMDDFIKGIDTKIKEAKENLLPLDIILEQIPSLKQNALKTPLFQMIYSENAEPNRTTANEISYKLFSSSFEVILLRNGDKLSIQYHKDLYNEQVFEQFLSHFINFLTDFILKNQKDIPLLHKDINYLGDKDIQFIENWNDTNIGLEEPFLIHKWIEKSASLNPNKIAVVQGRKSINYSELNEQSNRLANYLIQNGVEKNMYVAVTLDRSVELIVTLVAIMKTGAAYVPIEPNLPIDRIVFQMQDCEPDFLITNERYGLAMPVFWSNVINLDSLEDEIGEASNKDVHVEMEGKDPVYVIYTSGTTGNPKGAILHHKGVLNRLKWGVKNQLIGEDDCVLQKTQIGFDVSVWEIFGPLICGGKVVIADPEKDKDVNYLIELIIKHKITHIDFVPSMLQLFLENRNVMRCKSVKKVTAAGETLPKDLTTKFFSTLPQAELLNLYGPTEASLAVTWWNCVKEYDQEVIPIGLPMDNCQLYVVDKNLRLKAPGYIGEILIGGICVGDGYINRDDLTRERFITTEFSKNGKLYRTGDLGFLNEKGELHFVGRVDDQIKLRGYRIELGEIEAVLSSFEGIREAAVVVKGDKSENRYIVAYTVDENRATYTKTEVLNFCQRKLPNYMIPTIIVKLTEIPLTMNGKADKKSLELLNDDIVSKNETRDALNDFERLLAQIWKDVLNVDTVPFNASFFDIGGNSLLALRLLENISSHLDVKLDVFDLIENDSIEKMAVKLISLTVSV